MNPEDEQPKNDKLPPSGDDDRAIVRIPRPGRTGEPIRRYPRTIRRPARVEVSLEVTHKKRAVFSLRSLPLLLIAGFASAILIGALLLMLPVSSHDGEWTSPIVALFTSTSAVCVTGLVPVDTATYWSGFGQGVILVLIQFGGLGFMTSATLLFLLFGWRVGVRERMFISGSLDVARMGGVVTLTKRALLFTFVVEAIGFVILTLRFLTEDDLRTAAWRGLFHSVSAFNNAGFDVFGNFQSLEQHADFITLATISALLIIGGIGFLVLEDLANRKSRVSLSVDTKLVLRTTAVMIVVGFFVFLASEWDSTLLGKPLQDKVLHSWFHSVTPRTAGFDSLPVGQMNEETQFFTMGLMFVGGGSGSTAGGIKVGTLAVLLAAALSAIRGREHSEATGREIRRTDIDRALAVAFLGAGIIFVASLILAGFEDQNFLAILFETTSAFGTVGLSTGITPDLSDPGLLLVTLIMFIGRLGPLTLVLALAQRTHREYRRLPEERVRVG